MKQRQPEITHPDTIGDVETLTRQFLDHGLHSNAIAMTLEMNRLEVLSSDPRRANHLFLEDESTEASNLTTLVTQRALRCNRCLLTIVQILVEFSRNCW